MSDSTSYGAYADQVSKRYAQSGDSKATWDHAKWMEEVKMANDPKLAESTRKWMYVHHIPANYLDPDVPTTAYVPFNRGVYLDPMPGVAGTGSISGAGGVTPFSLEQVNEEHMRNINEFSQSPFNYLMWLRRALMANPMTAHVADAVGAGAEALDPYHFTPTQYLPLQGNPTGSAVLINKNALATSGAMLSGIPTPISYRTFDMEAPAMSASDPFAARMGSVFPWANHLQGGVGPASALTAATPRGLAQAAAALLQMSAARKRAAVADAMGVDDSASLLRFRETRARASHSPENGLHRHGHAAQYHNHPAAHAAHPHAAPTAASSGASVTASRPESPPRFAETSVASTASVAAGAGATATAGTESKAADPMVVHQYAAAPAAAMGAVFSTQGMAIPGAVQPMSGPVQTGLIPSSLHPPLEGLPEFMKPPVNAIPDARSLQPYPGWSTTDPSRGLASGIPIYPPNGAMAGGVAGPAPASPGTAMGTPPGLSVYYGPQPAGTSTTSTPASTPSTTASTASANSPPSQFLAPQLFPVPGFGMFGAHGAAPPLAGTLLPGEGAAAYHGMAPGPHAAPHSYYTSPWYWEHHRGHHEAADPSLLPRHRPSWMTPLPPSGPAYHQYNNLNGAANVNAANPTAVRAPGVTAAGNMQGPSGPPGFGMAMGQPPIQPSSALFGPPPVPGSTVHYLPYNPRGRHASYTDLHQAIWGTASSTSTTSTGSTTTTQNNIDGPSMPGPPPGLAHGFGSPAYHTLSGGYARALGYGHPQRVVSRYSPQLVAPPTMPAAAGGMQAPASSQSAQGAVDVTVVDGSASQGADRGLEAALSTIASSVAAIGQSQAQLAQAQAAQQERATLRESIESLGHTIAEAIRSSRSPDAPAEDVGSGMRFREKMSSEGATAKRQWPAPGVGYMGVAPGYAGGASYGYGYGYAPGPAVGGSVYGRGAVSGAPAYVPVSTAPIAAAPGSFATGPQTFVSAPSTQAAYQAAQAAADYRATRDARAEPAQGSMVPAPKSGIPQLPTGLPRDAVVTTLENAPPGVGVAPAPGVSRTLPFEVVPLDPDAASRLKPGTPMLVSDPSDALVLDPRIDFIAPKYTNAMKAAWKSKSTSSTGLRFAEASSESRGRAHARHGAGHMRRAASWSTSNPILGSPLAAEDDGPFGRGPEDANRVGPERGLKTLRERDGDDLLRVDPSLLKGFGQDSRFRQPAKDDLAARLAAVLPEPTIFLQADGTPATAAAAPQNAHPAAPSVVATRRLRHGASSVAAAASAAARFAQVAADRAAAAAEAGAGAGVGVTTATEAVAGTDSTKAEFPSLTGTSASAAAFGAVTPAKQKEANDAMLTRLLKGEADTRWKLGAASTKSQKPPKDPPVLSILDLRGVQSMQDVAAMSETLLNRQGVIGDSASYEPKLPEATEGGGAALFAKTVADPVQEPQAPLSPDLPRLLAHGMHELFADTLQRVPDALPPPDPQETSLVGPGEALTANAIDRSGHKRVSDPVPPAVIPLPRVQDDPFHMGITREIKKFYYQHHNLAPGGFEQPIDQLLGPDQTYAQAWRSIRNERNGPFASLLQEDARTQEAGDASEDAASRVSS